MTSKNEVLHGTSDPNPFLVPCPVETCDWTVVIAVEPPGPRESAYAASARFAEAAAATVEAELGEHALEAHDLDEFNAACEAVAAGLR